MINNFDELSDLANNSPKKFAQLLISQYMSEKNSIFELFGAEIKSLLQSNQKLFWHLWTESEQAQLDLLPPPNDKHQSLLNTLEQDGICIINDFFDKNTILLLQNEWENSFKQMPKQDEKAIQKALRNRFTFDLIDGIRYVQSSPFDNKQRILFQDHGKTPSAFSKFVLNNTTFSEVAQRHFKLNTLPTPSFVMAEYLQNVKMPRQDLFWHIDNLSDQFKVMVVLEDMSENDGPFTFIKGTHKVKYEYQERYHKMYAMNGLSTQEHNHFEPGFTSSESAEKAILNAGDIVLFDCKIHHSASFVKQMGSRKNLVLYFNEIPTIRNNILQKFDHFLNFGLR
ncbi:phytanoyl-CoA dioxygenase family protein [Pseudoalteromonas sp. MMG013]|uniref:phytanoyl-CoA dioxygenase family protein n=1 Tax=Pseudoalteromonas sp. MMG013 TaxID=2822687 RepID=UPI001B396FDF|nr:phytanoyl-CoA dioxygenase family protein [Pseudoalteromonas sp. MMG013]MBQ4861992.1 phytanoyl-CoA dioxygenase family protein [Pseudoalteromonas sp. MMG013]